VARVERGRRGALVLVIVLVMTLVWPVAAWSGPTRALAEAATDAPPPDTTAYVAVGPERLADTRRSDCGCTYLDAHTLRVQVAGRGGVPTEATAAALTITVAEARTDGGYVTVWPSGTPRSETSVLNFMAGQTRANSAIVRLGDAGAVDLYVFGDAELIVDVSGGFVPAAAASAGRLVTLDAVRVLDTRQPGDGGRLGPGITRTVTMPDDVPAGATAVAVNVTTTGTADGLGYLTVWPAGLARPEASVLTTDGAGQERAAFAIVPVSAAGLDVYSHSGGHLIVDVVGWFTGAGAAQGSDGLFVPQAPHRAMDTRPSDSPLPPGSALCAAVGDGAAVAANVTLTETWGAGYLTAWPAATPMPPTSNVNATRGGETVANGMIARRSRRGPDRLRIGRHGGADRRRRLVHRGAGRGGRDSDAVRRRRRVTLVPTPGRAAPARRVDAGEPLRHRRTARVRLRRRVGRQPADRLLRQRARRPVRWRLPAGHEAARRPHPLAVPGRDGPRRQRHGAHDAQRGDGPVRPVLHPPHRRHAAQPGGVDRRR
jgi:hypothetical protein